MCSRGALLLLGMAVVGGCSNAPSRLSPPPVPGDAGKSAVARYDRDGDGAIGGTELDSSPAIKSALRRLDADGDGKVTAEEIDARIRRVRESKVALKQVGITIRRNGRPLPGAEVRLIPEDFLGPAVKQARGTADSRGMAQIVISDAPTESGVHPGFFRVEVSMQVGDREMVPPKYNVESELGVEIADDNPAVENLTFELR